MKKYLYWFGFGLMTSLALVMSGLYLLEISGSPSVMESENDQPVVEAQQEVSTEPDAQEEQVAPIDAPAVYEAKIGKFRLELDPEYSVVVQTDGSFNNVKSTTMQIGRRTAAGVVSNFLNDSVKIEAFPASVNGSRDQFVTSDTILQSSGAKEERTLIDGVEARKFTTNSVGKTIKLYFERNDVTYLIEAWNVEDANTLEMYEHVVRSFRFR